MSINILALKNQSNLLIYMTPGVYEIRCLTKKKVYVGITQNILEKFGKHSATLAYKKHDCPALQEDWNLLGKEAITFTVVCCGPEWADNKDRLIKEASVIKEIIDESYTVYNTDLSASFVGNHRRSISIDGVIYESVSAAGRDPLLPSETVIRRRLSDPEFPNYIELGKISPKYLIDGKEFDTYKEIIEAGLANTDGAIRRRLNSSKWYNWVQIS